MHSSVGAKAMLLDVFIHDTTLSVGGLQIWPPLWPLWLVIFGIAIAMSLTTLIAVRLRKANGNRRAQANDHEPVAKR